MSQFDPPSLCHQKCDKIRTYPRGDNESIFHRPDKWGIWGSRFERVRENLSSPERRTKLGVQVRAFAEPEPELRVQFSPVRVRTDFPNRTLGTLTPSSPPTPILTSAPWLNRVCSPTRPLRRTTSSATTSNFHMHPLFSRLHGARTPLATGNPNGNGHAQ